VKQTAMSLPHTRRARRHYSEVEAGELFKTRYTSVKPPVFTPVIFFKKIIIDFLFSKHHRFGVDQLTIVTPAPLRRKSFTGYETLQQRSDKSLFLHFNFKKINH